MTIEPSIVATTISLTASAAAVAPGQSFSLKAEVSAVGSAAPVTGSATLYLRQTVLGTVNIAAGTGVVQTQVPLAGTYSASAVFARQGSFLASKGQPVSFTVEAPAALLPPAGPASSGTFSLGLSSNAVSLNSERTASMQVMVAGLHGYTGNVQLSCAGLPNALSCSFSPSRLGVSAASATSATSTLFLGAPINTAYNSPMLANITQALLLPWDFPGVVGLLAGKTRLRGHWHQSVLLCLALLGAAAGLTGCGLTVNTVTRPHVVNVTATGANQLADNHLYSEHHRAGRQVLGIL